jgi:hypothetical protein
MLTTRHTNPRGGLRGHVSRCLFASVVFGLSLLIAAPFLAVLLVPVYITFYFSGLYYP